MLVSAKSHYSFKKAFLPFENVQDSPQAQFVSWPCAVTVPYCWADVMEYHRIPLCPPGSASEREVCHRRHGGDRLQWPGRHDPGPERHLLLRCRLHHHLRLRLAQQTARSHLRHQRKLLLLCWGCTRTHTHKHTIFQEEVPNCSLNTWCSWVSVSFSLRFMMKVSSAVLAGWGA